MVCDHLNDFVVKRQLRFLWGHRAENRDFRKNLDFKFRWTILIPLYLPFLSRQTVNSNPVLSLSPSQPNPTLTLHQRQGTETFPMASTTHRHVGKVKWTPLWPCLSEIMNQMKLRNTWSFVEIINLVLCSPFFHQLKRSQDSLLSTNVCQVLYKHSLTPFSWWPHISTYNPTVWIKTLRLRKVKHLAW